MWKKHPKALPFLFFSEMWERFGYYLMIGIFTLYLKDVKEGFAMTEAESAVLYLSMALVIFGNGFFKPNISTLLGNVYSTPQYEKQKDDGYNIFYMGINIGAFICNFISAALYVTYGWGAAFFSAGIGMFIGVAIFIIGTKHYKAHDIKKGVGENDMPMSRIVLLILVPSIVAGIIGWIIPGTLVG